MELEKNIYGLCEGVFKACQFLGLQFPPEALNKSQPLPSDYFGSNFELDSQTLEKLQAERKLSGEDFTKIYTRFKEKYLSQKPFKHTKTDLSVYFCDYLLFTEERTGASTSDYFDFEFYVKSFATRDEFITQRDRNRLLKTCCNAFSYMLLIDNKVKTNKRFGEFLHRDWLDTRNCSFEEFKIFAENHPRFFSKPFNGSFGRGAEIINIKSNTVLKKIFTDLKTKESLLEEVVNQHESIRRFCSDTLNTIRVNTFLDVHNNVHILTTGGRFGRMGSVVDNFHGGGISVVIDPLTGIIVSDGINRIHERMSKHPDTRKIFKGFQYPAWENLRETVIKMAKLIPQVPHIGWDMAINDKGEAVLIEANNNPDVDVQQAPDSVGRMYLYKPLIDEVNRYKQEQLRILGYRINDIHNFNSTYDPNASRHDSRLEFAITKLIPDCASLLDLGCRKAQFVKTICPKNVKYIPADFKKHDNEVIACDFNRAFPNVKVDTCLCAFTAEYVKTLPKFLAAMCKAAQKQILMLCRPFDKEGDRYYRWRHAFVTDFTETYLLEVMTRNNFQPVAQYPTPGNRSVILYDFRKIGG